MDSGPQLVSNYVRTFVETDGGSLRFAPIRDDDGRLCWVLFGVLPDGTEKPVVLSKTGKPRMFKSSDAVLAYWQDLYPDSDGLFIPVLPVSGK